MSRVEGQSVASMTVKTLQLIRTDEQFESFGSIVNTKARALEVSEPILPRRCKRPKRFEVGNADPEFPDSAKSLYKSVYFTSLDAIVTCIQNQFDQPGYTILCQMEALLMKAINNKDFSEELDSVCSFCPGEIDAAVLKPIYKHYQFPLIMKEIVLMMVLLCLKM